MEEKVLAFIFMAFVFLPIVGIFLLIPILNVFVIKELFFNE